MRKEEFYFPSRDNCTKIHAVRWIPDSQKPDCIVQIVHGMAEYIERYEEFARFLTDKNVLVTGEDHLGHGKTIGEDGIPGYFCEQDPATVVVRDVHRLKKINQEVYPGVPYIILGHSMGSFIVRNYICRYGSGIEGAIVCGTGMQSGVLLTVSKIVAGIQKFIFGDEHVSHFIDKCVFGSYNKKIENPRTSKDWLTKDEEIVDTYLMDSLCGFTFTVNGFSTLFELISRVRKEENLQKNAATAYPIELTIQYINAQTGKSIKQADSITINNYGVYKDNGTSEPHSLNTFIAGYMPFLKVPKMMNGTKSIKMVYIMFEVLFGLLM